MTMNDMFDPMDNLEMEQIKSLPDEVHSNNPKSRQTTIEGSPNPVNQFGSSIQMVQKNNNSMQALIEMREFEI